MKPFWYIIIPYKLGGYVGLGKQGEVFGATRMDVISHLLRLTYSNHEQ